LVKIMEENMQNSRANQKIEVPEKGEIRICRTKDRVSFRLKEGNKARLDTLIDYLKVDNASQALNLMIERWHDMKEDKIRAIHEIKQLMASKGIGVGEL